ncbi:hypothetical protein [uncultured Mailhella sp.]|uniref:hypothetical protein n=1 Tax=uncultured Mailhella sp. TaxID=1981031 RepID=UPI0025F1165D|nr:hypothetical protein [uncultured Mailhella sp.]
MHFKHLIKQIATAQLLYAKIAPAFCPTCFPSTSMFRLNPFAFQTIRPVVLRKNAVFPLNFGRMALCRCIAFSFLKANRSWREKEMKTGPSVQPKALPTALLVKG